jgi:hypothetical protein
VTVRARALDYLAACFGCGTPALLARIGTAAPTALQEFTAATARLEVGPVRVWMRASSPGAPLAYGIRNSRLNAALQDALPLGVVQGPPSAGSVEELRALAPGRSPMIVLAAPAPFGPLAEATGQLVAAYQLALRQERPGLPAEASRFCARSRDGGLDLAMFYPFRDALSPAATHYAAAFRVVEGGQSGELEVEPLRETALGLARCWGLAPVDPAETESSAALPITRAPRDAERDSILDLHGLAHAGAPIITGDGILRASLAGLVAAEAVLGGAPPARQVWRALSRYRRVNRIMKLELRELAKLTALFVRLAARPLLYYPHSLAEAFDMWSSKLERADRARAMPRGAR